MDCGALGVRSPRAKPRAALAPDENVQAAFEVDLSAGLRLLEGGASQAVNWYNLLLARPQRSRI